MLSAQSVVHPARYPSNQQKEDRFTAGTATNQEEEESASNIY